MPVAPKSVRTQSSCQYIFTLFGSTGTNAACKMLVESTTGVDINNILQASFTNESVLRSLLVLNEKMCPTQSLIL